MKHKRLSAWLAACVMLSALPQLSLPAQAAKTKLLGDVTADGAVSVADGVLLARYVNKWDGAGADKDAADLDRDGETDPLRIAKQPNPFVIDYGEDAKLTVKAAGGTAPYTYQWMMNGEEIDGAVVLKEVTTTTTTTTATTESTTTTTTTTESTTTAATEPEFEPGDDIDGDGAFSVADAVLLQRFVTEDRTLSKAKIAKLLKAAPDRDGDGTVTVLDVALLLRKLNLG